MFSLEAGRLECATVLVVKYRANTNMSNGTCYPLHLAIKYSYDQLIDILLQHGADINRCDTETNKSPLYMAVEMQDYDIATKLLKAKPDLTLRDNAMGETALHTSMRLCNTTREVMLTGLMLDQTKKNPQLINAEDKDGNTVLHIAVQRCTASQSSISLVELTLGFNPNPLIKNKKGEIPSDLVLNISENQKFAEALNEYMINWMKENSNQVSSDVFPSFLPGKQHSIALTTKTAVANTQLTNINVGNPFPL